MTTTPRRRFTADAFWRVIDRASSLAMVAAFVALLAGVGLVIRNHRATAANPAAGAPAVDQEPIANDLIVPLGRIVKGHDTAVLAMIEFSDFECPFCARYATGTHARLERDLVDTGRLRYAFRHLPLPIHRQAVAAGTAAECAGREQRFWDMYDRLFAHQQLLAPQELPRHAAAIGLDHRRFAACLEDASAEVLADRAEAERLGITSTPTFLIGTVVDGDRIRVVRRVRGAYPPDVFMAIVDELQAEARR